MEGELGRAVVVETIGKDMSVELGELGGIVTVDLVDMELPVVDEAVNHDVGVEIVLGLL